MKNNNYNRNVLICIYCLPQIILTMVIPSVLPRFQGVETCISDYFLFFYNWLENSFMCTYEIVFTSLLMVVLIKRELTPNRVVLYDSMLKLFGKCVRECIVITLAVPIFNSAVIMCSALYHGGCYECNWNQEISFAQGQLPRFRLTEVNTLVVIAVSLFLDIVRMQLTMFIAIVLYWLTRLPVVDYIVIYINVVLMMIPRGLSFINSDYMKSIYDPLVMDQLDVYSGGISLKNNVIVPLVMLLVVLVVSIAAFRFYRKDMLKN